MLARTLECIEQAIFKLGAAEDVTASCCEPLGRQDEGGVKTRQGTLVTIKFIHDFSSGDNVVGRGQ